MKRIIDVLAAGVKDAAGEPLIGGSVYFYSAGTTTLQTVYQDWDLTEPHANPASLDSSGGLTAYADGRVKLVILDENGTLVRSLDHVGTSDDDITTAAISIVAGNGVSVGADDSFNVNVDGSTLTIDANNQVKIGSQGVSATELLDHGVTGIKLNANSVDDSTLQYTSDQLSVKDLGITRRKLAALNQATSASVINPTQTGTGVANYIDVTNGSISVTSAYGRPILLFVQPDSTALGDVSHSNGGIGVNATALGSIGEIYFRWVRGSTALGVFRLYFSIANIANDVTDVALVTGTPLMYMDIGVAAGTYTYKLQFSTDSGDGLVLGKFKAVGFEM